MWDSKIRIGEGYVSGIRIRVGCTGLGYALERRVYADVGKAAADMGKIAADAEYGLLFSCEM